MLLKAEATKLVARKSSTSTFSFSVKWTDTKKVLRQNQLKPGRIYWRKIYSVSLHYCSSKLNYWCKYLHFPSETCLNGHRRRRRKKKGLLPFWYAFFTANSISTVTDCGTQVQITTNQKELIRKCNQKNATATHTVQQQLAQGNSNSHNATHTAQQ